VSFFIGVAVSPFANLRRQGLIAKGNFGKGSLVGQAFLPVTERRTRRSVRTAACRVPWQTGMSVLL